MTTASNDGTPTTPDSPAATKPGGPGSALLTFKSQDREYTLARISDKIYFDLRRRRQTVPIFEDYELMYFLERDPELIYPDMAKMFVTLQAKFGPSGRCFDDWKGSFGFAFLLTFEHEGKPCTYLLNLANVRSMIEFHWYKVVSADDNTDRSILHRPFPDFPEQEMRYVIAYLISFLSGYFESLEKWYDEFFFQTVESNLIIFGYRDGQFFEQQYESQEAFEAAKAELKAQAAEQKAKAHQAQ